MGKMPAWTRCDLAARTIIITQKKSHGTLLRSGKMTPLWREFDRGHRFSLALTLRQGPYNH